MDEPFRFVHMFAKSVGLVCRWDEIKVGLIAA